MTKPFTMEEVLLRFPHIGEEIFDVLDEESLENCKKVCKIWKNFIEDPKQKLKWIKEIKANEKNAALRRGFISFPLKFFISGPNPKWSKLPIQDLRDFVYRLNYKRNESILFETFLEKYAELKVELNAKWDMGRTIFHLASFFGHSKLVNIILKKSYNLKIDLNAKDMNERTAIYQACGRGNTKIVKMMIENAESSKLDFKIKDCKGRTAFQGAKLFGKQNIVDLIKSKLPAGTF